MVCTGNICRSPMAERLASVGLRRRHAGPPDASLTDFRSAGVRAWSGEPIHPYATQVLEERGADPDGFRARGLTPAMVAEADLVLCATRAHRSEVVRMVPRAVRRTFTLREFGRLTEGLDHTSLNHDPITFRTAADRFVVAAAGGRGVAEHQPIDDDLADPLGGDLDVFRACADQIEAALAPPLRLLADLLSARVDDVAGRS